MTQQKAKIITDSKQMTMAKYDRWVNAVNKFGGANDPISKTYFSRDYAVSRDELHYMFEGDWVARKAIEIPAQDATREFITIIHDDPGVVDLMNDELERLEVRDKFEEAILLQRLYGGNAMIIGAYDGQTVDTPIGKIRRVDFFNNVDRFLAYPLTFYQNPELQNYGMVETYQVMNLTVVGSQIIKVHESRVIRFNGNYLPPVLRVRNFGWGAPVIHNIFEALRQFGTATQAGASTLQDFITKKLKIANLADLISTDVGEAELINRLQVMAQELAINNIAIYGADEEFDKMGTPLTGFHEMLDKYMDITSAAVGIPKSRFFSNMTGVLGGDAGEADLRVHYDNIAALQKNRLNSRMRKVIDAIAEPHGFGPGIIKFKWKPLWQLSELDDAKVRKEVAETDKIYLDAGVIEPEEVAISRFSGESIDINNMTINVDRRKKFLAQLAKQPISLGEGDGEADDDPAAAGGEVPDLENPGKSEQIKNAGQGENAS